MFAEIGAEEVSDLCDLDDDDLSSFNLKKIQDKKLRRALAKLGNNTGVIQAVIAPPPAAITGFVGKMHVTYSREDSELLVKVQSAALKANWQVTGVMSNQGKEWFLAWSAVLEKADGVCVFFTEGDAMALNNTGVGYVEKLSLRFESQGEDAALYIEAMAILAVKGKRPDFKIYVVDGLKHTAEQLAFNLMDDAPSFGPVDKWCAFIHGLLAPPAAAPVASSPGHALAPAPPVHVASPAPAPTPTPAPAPLAPVAPAPAAPAPTPALAASADTAASAPPVWASLSFDEMSNMPKYKAYSKLIKKFGAATMQERMQKNGLPADEIAHFVSEYKRTSS
jgi:hypothetical protein